MNHRLTRVRRLLRRVVGRARSCERTETCPYCQRETQVVGMHTKFEHCRDARCRDRHYWKVHFGIERFPDAIPTGRKEQRAMRRILLDHD